jgi:hypothetical protein
MLFFFSDCLKPRPLRVGEIRLFSHMSPDGLRPASAAAFLLVRFLCGRFVHPAPIPPHQQASRRNGTNDDADE